MPLLLGSSSSCSSLGRRPGPRPTPPLATSSRPPASRRMKKSRFSSELTTTIVRGRVKQILEISDFHKIRKKYTKNTKKTHQKYTKIRQKYAKIHHLSEQAALHMRTQQPIRAAGFFAWPCHLPQNYFFAYGSH